MNFEGENFESEVDAYEIYNDYSYRMGVGARKSKTRKRAKSEDISMRQFVAGKRGIRQT